MGAIVADYTRAHTIRELRACGWELIAAAGDLERGEAAPLLDEVARRVQALAEERKEGPTCTSLI